MTKDYIGVKKVSAWPQEKDGKEGYAVKYEDGYISWSPKDVFERSYFHVANEGRISQEDVDAFIGGVTDQKLDAKTTHVRAELLTGFVQHEVSSCVRPENYDHAIGVSCAKKRIEDRVWAMLGFVLQWAENGLKGRR